MAVITVNSLQATQNPKRERGAELRGALAPRSRLGLRGNGAMTCSLQVVNCYSAMERVRPRCFPTEMLSKKEHCH